MRSLPFACAFALAGLVASQPCSARTLTVGAGGEFKTPSAAVAQARDGDVVSIAPGQYFDCAVIRQNNLTLQGNGAGAVMTDKTCQGKALLVIDGNDVTIRNLTLQRARVPDGNGAGIRAEGGNLTVENTRFINNQDGILSADAPNATIRIAGSEFIENGTCGNSCAHGIYIGHVKSLRVERSHFADTHDGHHIKSRAMRTEIVGNTIEDGADGTASYLIDIPNGGTTIIEGNQLEKGPHASNQAYAISIGEEGVDRPTDQIVVRDNHFTNDQNRPTTFVRNLTATPAQLSNNTFKGQVRPLEGDGSRR